MSAADEIRKSMGARASAKKLIADNQDKDSPWWADFLGPLSEVVCIPQWFSREHLDCDEQTFLLFCAWVENTKWADHISQELPEYVEAFKETQ